jgi:hypothetical protein
MWKFHRPIFDGHPGITQVQSNVLGFWLGYEIRLRAFQWTRNGGLVASNCSKAGCYLGSSFMTERSVSFGYADDKKATLGRNHVAAALKDAEQVLGHFRS